MKKSLNLLLLIMGLAAMGGGLYLIFTSPDTPDPETTLEAAPPNPGPATDSIAPDSLNLN